jgi:hypothetical protein
VTLAIHLHVVHSHNVEISMVHHLVLVHLPILDLLQIVVLNVQSTLNAQATKHASMRSVETHVLDLVVLMLFAQSSIILLFVHVQSMILVIRSQTVMLNLLHVRSFSLVCQSCCFLNSLIF